MGGRIWAERLWLFAAAGVTLAILGFYAARLFIPLPIFAGDEAAYLIRALYPPAVVAAAPFVVPLNNGVHLSVIRAVYETGAPFIVGDRLVNAGAYLGGLALLWGSGTARLPRREQIALGLLALAFPYYRFAFSNLAEGLFVGVLALLCLVTGRWYRSRPIVHAILAGAIAAALVLVKPNALAAIGALAAVAVLEATANGGWRRLPLRGLLFAVTFFAIGNLIQWAAEEPASHPLAFFVGDFYAGELALPPAPGALATGGLALGSMSAALALMAGAPILIGLGDLISRWRARRGRAVVQGPDLIFLLLLFSAAATLVMVTVFVSKIAWTPSETKRLWGRYFEFFVPLLWLAAAPALARPISPRTRLACAALMLAGLIGLLASLQAGIVLFPWDASALTAFFQPDPVRAPLGSAAFYRPLATLAALLAAGAVALRVSPTQAGLGLILALGGLSTWLDHVWVGPMVAQRYALERDIRSLEPRLPPEPALIVLLAPDANVGNLGFLRLNARPHVFLGPPSRTSVGDLAGAQAVVVSGPETPPGGPWLRTFKGDDLSVFRPAAGR